MRAQLERLLELSERPKVTLQVIPFKAGALPSGNKFIILRFASAEVKDVVFIEGLTGDVYLDDPDEVETYNTTFSTLVQLAASTDKTRAIIAGMIPSYGPPPTRTEYDRPAGTQPSHGPCRLDRPVPVPHPGP